MAPQPWIRGIRVLPIGKEEVLPDRIYQCGRSWDAQAKNRAITVARNVSAGKTTVTNKTVAIEKNAAETTETATAAILPA